MKKIRVSELEPLYVSWEGFAKLTNIPVATLRNRLSEGKLPIKARYFNSKPLFSVAEIQVMMDALPTEPAVKRGRKRKGNSGGTGIQTDGGAEGEGGAWG